MINRKSLHWPLPALKWGAKYELNNCLRAWIQNTLGFTHAKPYLHIQQCSGSQLIQTDNVVPMWRIQRVSLKVGFKEISVYGKCPCDGVCGLMAEEYPDKIIIIYYIYPNWINRNLSHHFLPCLNHKKRHFLKSPVGFSHHRWVFLVSIQLPAGAANTHRRWWCVHSCRRRWISIDLH